ncbi:MAG: AAA family ATPase, partial [Candidatus Omnitrophica bacterium]|nr:AAA family ATPase [Candidatus Omnitrophota bacterium]
IQFSPESIERLCKYTNGIPRVINIICDKALLLGFIKETTHIGEDIIKQSIAELEGQFSFVPV